MPRLESLANAGYFPTPWPVVQQIRGVLRRPWSNNRLRDKVTYRFLDPCCGTGEAVEWLADQFVDQHGVPVETFGIEVSEERATEARERLDNVLNADLFHCSVAHNSLSLLYLNPPYDDEGYVPGQGSRRTEFAFLARTTPYLIPNQGILIYVIPKRILERDNVSRYLSSQYRNLRCWDFPPEEREAFGQVVVCGVRKERPTPAIDAEKVRRWATNPPDYRSVTRYDPRYELHFGQSGKILFNNMYLDPQIVAKEAAVKGLWVNPTMRQALWPENDDLKRPLMPLRQGHVAMLTAAGFLDNMMLERDGQRILVKGRTYKEFETIEESDEKIVRLERMRTTVVSLDLDTGIFTDIKA